eukprot:scaffold171372_cov30-Tisochrysis_lutea.AAC.1
MGLWWEKAGMTVPLKAQRSLLKTVRYGARAATATPPFARCRQAPPARAGDEPMDMPLTPKRPRADAPTH